MTPRCRGSDAVPARHWKGRDTCPVCGRRIAPRADGLMRKHRDLRPREHPTRKVTPK